MRFNYYIPPENAEQLEGCPLEEAGGYRVSTVIFGLAYRADNNPTWIEGDCCSFSSCKK